MVNSGQPFVFNFHSTKELLPTGVIRGQDAAFRGFFALAMIYFGLRRGSMRTALLCLLVLPLQGAPEDIFSAIRANHLADLEKADLTVHDRRGNTPLMYAAAFGSVEAVRRLIDAGSDVNARNGFGATPLIWAAGIWRRRACWWSTAPTSTRARNRAGRR